MSYTPLNNIILEGDPRGVTAAPGDDDTSLATTAFVQGELGNFLSLAGGTMTGNITLDAGVDLELAADGVVSWDGGAAQLSYDSGDDVILSDSPIRVSIAPSDGNDLVNKDYVDGVATGLDVKASCRVASIAPITLAGPGASIDGVSLSNGDRVLVKNQGDAEENGIYVFNGAAVAMTRAEDADQDAEVTAGMFTFIEEGTHGDQGWVLTTNNPIEVGVTELAFSQFSNAVIVSTLDSLTDVDVTGAVTDAALRFDGTNWVDTANILLEDANSKIVLGGDANLYRSQANVLKTDDSLDVANELYMSGTDSSVIFTGQDNALNPIMSSNVGAEAQPRFAVTAKGDLAWGDGTNAVDVSLSRYAADVLLTPDSLAVGADLSLYGADSDISFTMQDDATNAVIKAKVSGDANERLQIQVDGKILLGGGTNAADVNLYRSAENVLKTDDNFDVGGELYMSAADGSILFNAQSLSTNNIFASKVTGDVEYRIYMAADGKMQWGDGALAPDVNLYRDAADVLKTDDSLKVAGSMFVGPSELEIIENGDGDLEIVSAELILKNDLRIDGDNLSVYEERGVSDEASFLYSDSLQFESTNGEAYVGYDDGAMELILSADGKVRVESLLEVDSGLRFKAINQYSANQTLVDSDHIVLVDTTGGAVTMTLPAAPTAGQIFQIKDAGGNAEAEPITIDGNGANIDGDATVDMGVNYQSATVIFDGAAWHLI